MDSDAERSDKELVLAKWVELFLLIDGTKCP